MGLEINEEETKTQDEMGEEPVEASIDGGPGENVFFEDEVEASEEELMGTVEPETKAEGDESETDKAESSPSEDEAKKAEEEAKAKAEKEAEPETDEEKKAAEEKAKVDADAKAKEDEKVKAEEEAKAKAEEDAKDKKPPKGYVPQEALYEERGKRQAADRTNEDLQGQIDLLGKQLEEAKKSAPRKDGFVKLSDEEIEELMEDDPDEVKRYYIRLDRAEKEDRDAKEESDQVKARQKAVLEEDGKRIEEAYARVNKEVPGLYSNDSSVGEGLSKFLRDNGFKSTMLGIMTDPKTLIKGQKDDHPTALGEGAADFLVFVNNAHQLVSSASKPTDDKELRAEITKEVRAELEAEYEGKVKEFNQKLKDSAGDNFKGLGELPSASGDVKGTDISENELMKMSDADHDDWLRRATPD